MPNKNDDFDFLFNSDGTTNEEKKKRSQEYNEDTFNTDNIYEDDLSELDWLLNDGENSNNNTKGNNQHNLDEDILNDFKQDSEVIEEPVTFNARDKKVKEENRNRRRKKENKPPKKEKPIFAILFLGVLALSIILLLFLLVQKIEIIDALENKVNELEKVKETTNEGKTNEIRNLEIKIEELETENSALSTLQEEMNELKKYKKSIEDSPIYKNEKLQKELEKEIEKQKKELEKRLEEIKDKEKEIVKLDSKIAKKKKKVVEIENEPLEIPAGTYLFGSDIDSGRYVVKPKYPMESNKFFVFDENDFAVVNIDLGSDGVDEYTFEADDLYTLDTQYPIELYEVK